MCVCIHTCDVYIHVCTRVGVLMRVHIRVHVGVHACGGVCARVGVCVCTCVCINGGLKKVKASPAVT